MLVWSQQVIQAQAKYATKSVDSITQADNEVNRCVCAGKQVCKDMCGRVNS